MPSYNSVNEFVTYNLKLIISKFPFSRFIVRDRSMEPAYFEGDRVLTFNWGKLRKGDVVVFNAPWLLRALRFHSVLTPRSNLKKRLPRPALFNEKGGTRNDKKVYMIKRIEKIREGQVFVSGDNENMTSEIGPVQIAQIMGKVIWKY